MLCWYCYWGWPKAVADIYDRAKKDIDDMDSEIVGGESALEYGPGHVVWSDENFDLAAYCAKDCTKENCPDWPIEIIERVKKSLLDLAALPESVYDCEPKDYDGEHPENYQPVAGHVMVKK